MAMLYIFIYIYNIDTNKIVYVTMLNETSFIFGEVFKLYTIIILIFLWS